MSSVLFYCLQLVLCSVVLFAYYLFALKNRRMHQFNRFYLLSIPVLSALVPLIRIEFSRPVATAEQPVPFKFFEVVADNNTHLEDYVVQTATVTESVSLLLVAYVTGAAILLAVLFTSLFKIFLQVKRGSCRRICDAWLVSSRAKGTPYSFFHFIFWNDEIDINSRVGQQVLQHELSHVKEKHSIDKIVMSIFLCLAWFNPVFWLVRKELNMVHEFIADRAAVDADPAGFAEMLLTACYPGVGFGITSSFFHSPVKRRLAMITRFSLTRFTRLRQLIVIPVLGIALLLFAFRGQVANAVGLDPLNKLAPVTETCDPGELRKLDLRNNFKPAVVVQNTVVKLNRVYRVVLDAGHGGHDGGARGEDGTLESQLALELVKTILEENSNENIQLVLTRATDIYQHPADKVTLSKKNKADVFVSIHAGADQDPVANGIELFVPTQDSLRHYKSSYTFANNLANKLVALDKEVQIKQRKNGIWVVNASECPAVLIETGYLTNPKDLEKLKDKNYQRKLARAILRGIEAYLLEMDC